MDSETKQKIQEIRVLEHNLQQLLMQKQAIQMELNETLNALHELKHSKDKEVYRILGSIMLKTESSKISIELEEKKKVLDLRITSLEKQEKIIESRAESLHSEVTRSLEKQEKS